MENGSALIDRVADLERQVDALKRIVTLLMQILGQLNEELWREAPQETERASIQQDLDANLRMIQEEIKTVWPSSKDS